MTGYKFTIERIEIEVEDAAAGKRIEVFHDLRIAQASNTSGDSAIYIPVLQKGAPVDWRKLMRRKEFSDTEVAEAEGVVAAFFAGEGQ